MDPEVTSARPALVFKYLPVKGCADSIRLLISEARFSGLGPKISVQESVEVMQKLRTASPETGSRPEWGWREEATGPKRGLFSALAAGSGADSSLQMDRQSKGALPSPARAMFASFIPTLEIWPTTGPGGPTTVLQHARVVYRYLSKVYGLAGRSQAESDAVDMIVEESDCIREELQAQDFSRFEDALTDYAVKTMQMGWIDDYLTREFLDLSAQLTHNDASCAHFVGSSLTAADLSVLSMLTTVDTQLPSALASFPALAMFYKKMNARPSVRACARY